MNARNQYTFDIDRLQALLSRFPNMSDQLFTRLIVFHLEQLHHSADMFWISSAVGFDVPVSLNGTTEGLHVH